MAKKQGKGVFVRPSTLILAFDLLDFLDVSTPGHSHCRGCGGEQFLRRQFNKSFVERALSKTGYVDGSACAARNVVKVCKLEQSVRAQPVTQELVPISRYFLHTADFDPVYHWQDAFLQLVLMLEDGRITEADLKDPEPAKI